MSAVYTASGVLHPRVFRGRALSDKVMSSKSARDAVERFKPVGKYCRRRLLVSGQRHGKRNFSLCPPTYTHAGAHAPRIRSRYLLVRRRVWQQPYRLLHQGLRPWRARDQPCSTHVPWWRATKAPACAGSTRCSHAPSSPSWGDRSGATLPLCPTSRACG